MAFYHTCTLARNPAIAVVDGAEIVWYDMRNNKEGVWMSKTITASTGVMEVVS